MAAFKSSRWLLPEGLVVESIRREAGSITVAARSVAGDAVCPSCGGRSRRVHSRYLRSLLDLPCSGHVLRISVMVRRFRCTRATCPARIFAERLGAAIAAPFARRTSRLDRLAHHLGLALGGRPGAGLTRVRPEVLQVADRWHLLENASAAFLDAVRRLTTRIRRTTGTTVVDPAPPHLCRADPA